MNQGLGAGVGRTAGDGVDLGVGVGRGVAVAVAVAVAVGVDVAVAVAVLVAVAVAVAVAVGVGEAPPQKLTLTLSTRQPVCETELSEHILQRSFTGWPTPAAGRFTATLWKPPDMPLQLGRLGKHGFMNAVLMLVWLYPPVTKLPPAVTMS